jgi:hypothetical protein
MNTESIGSIFGCFCTPIVRNIEEDKCRVTREIISMQANLPRYVSAEWNFLESAADRPLQERQGVRVLFAGGGKRKGKTEKKVPVNNNNIEAPPNSELVDNLIAGRWGEAFSSVAAGLNLEETQATITITNATIDKIFAWKDGVSDPCKQSYAKIIENLLTLETGKALIKGIIIEHHNSVGLSKVEFKCDSADTTSRCEWNDHPSPCTINLEWESNRHTETDWILLVKNTTLGDAAGNDQIDFVKVKVSPEVIFAHELGHFLYGITAQRKISSKLFPNVTNEAIQNAAANNGNVTDSTLVASASVAVGIADPKMNVYAQTEYENILREVVTVPPQTDAAKLFISCWNNGEYGEVVNILPVARMLPQVAGRLDYSDGAIIGEAFNADTFPADRKPKFHKLDSVNDNEPLHPNWANVDAKKFVRFGHIHWSDFRNDFEGLKGNGKTAFRGIVASLIGKIRANVSDGAGKLTVANLPGVNL